MDKKKITAIVCLAIIFILFFIGSSFLKKSETASDTLSVTQTPENEIASTTTISATANPDLETKYKLNLLVSDAERFINAYTAVTDGTLSGQKKYYKNLESLMTDSAKKTYLNMDMLDDESNFVGSAQPAATITNQDITVYYSLTSINDNDARVYLNCTQTIKSTTTSSSYPYHFRGKFVFDANTQTWQCDKIEIATSYQEN